MNSSTRLLQGIDDKYSVFLVVAVGLVGLSIGMAGLIVCLVAALLGLGWLVILRTQGRAVAQTFAQKIHKNIEQPNTDGGSHHRHQGFHHRHQGFHHRHRKERAPRGLMDKLGLVFVVAVVIRFLTVILVNATPIWLAIGPDAITWEYYGRLVILSWSMADWNANILLRELGEQSFFPTLNALSIVTFGSARYPVSFLNAMMGIGTAFVAAKLAAQTYGLRTARRTFVLVLFYPSLMLWSAMNFREVWAHMAILLIMVAGQSVRSRFAPGALVLLLASLGLLYFIRPYLFGLILFPLVVSMVVVRAKQLPFAVVGLVGISLFVTVYGQRFGVGSMIALEEQLATVQMLREGLAYGGSAYGENVDTRTLTGALLYMPYGVAQFLFAPFPWNVRSNPQLIALPESVFFLYLSIQATRQIIRDVRTKLSTIILPLCTIITLTCAYGLVSGNEGTAFRHRAQIIIITIMFSAAAQTQRRGATVRRQKRRVPLRTTLIRSSAA